METLRVMTFNFHLGGYEDRTLNKQAAYINKQKPDIVFLQEIDVFVDRRNWLQRLLNSEYDMVDQPSLLAAKCNFPHHVFGKGFDYGGGKVGQAILSRFPITNVIFHPGPKRLFSSDSDFIILEAATNIFGVRHRLFGFHLPPKNDWQKLDIFNAEGVDTAFANSLHAMTCPTAAGWPAWALRPRAVG